MIRITLVNTPITAKELARIRLAAQRGQPYGDPAWVARAAKTLDLEHTLRPEGRPRKTPLIRVKLNSSAVVAEHTHIGPRRQSRRA